MDIYTERIYYLPALAETSPSGRLPPLFAARDPLHNNAAAHPEYLLSASTSD